MLVSLVVVNRLDDYFLAQERDALATRAQNVRDVLGLTIDFASGDRAPVSVNDVVDESVVSELRRPGFLDGVIANELAQADVTIVLGRAVASQAGWDVVPAANGGFSSPLTAAPPSGASREHITYQQAFGLSDRQGYQYGLELTLADPYSFRASTLANVTGLLLVVGTFGIAVSVFVAALLALRFASPLRRLTAASRQLAEGDLSGRVPAVDASEGSTEITDLSRQFNRMADRLEELVAIARRDRDRSRDFLADVSHELRTPIAALRAFNELLQERAGEDPATRAEFLEASREQLARLDWLAQNLLELSKLDSGLVLLEIRRTDLRDAVESATQQSRLTAERRGVSLELDLPSEPVVVVHDAQRIAQVVANLVGNAVKFTPRGGHVRVRLRPSEDGATIAVVDTGIGIDQAELPHIFERFYRGSRSEARSSGSGLGLSIAKSIVDLHHGRIGVSSRVGTGSRFEVLLPGDPRPHALATTAAASAGAGGPDARTTDDRPASSRAAGVGSGMPDGDRRRVLP
ncbi:MAG TPA: HAMP domain-containing sensor histidine kinase [Candidatus Dormibacteraeota bacterium]|nr:HAMP domain-containing sensor histidine kinase [Candidatus Dormibacteraeota bacterium]